MPTPLLPSDNNTERAFGPYGIPEGALASPPQNGPGSSQIELHPNSWTG